LSTTAKVNYTVNESGLLAGEGDQLKVLVHFASSVQITGSPQLSLTITDDAGNSHVVNASFQPDNGATGTVTQTSMEFVYTLAANDAGQFHIGSISLNGGSILDAANTTLAADIAIPDSLKTIGELETFIYPASGLTTAQVGTSGNDLLAYYAQTVFVSGSSVISTTPTNGVFAGIDGGAGNRDVLYIPMFIPTVQTSSSVANAYILHFNEGDGRVELRSPNGTIEATSTVPTPGNFPVGVEIVVYQVLWVDPSNNVQFADVEGVGFFGSRLEIAGFQIPTDHAIFGTSGADVIDKSGDTNAASRYLIQTDLGNDTITGSSGTDVVRAAEGNDIVNTGPGNDFIFVDKGTDAVDGGTGTDTLVLEVQGMQPALLARFTGPAVGSQQGTWNNGVFTASSTSGEYRLSMDDNGNLYVKEYFLNGGALNTAATSIEQIQVRYANWDGRTTIAVVNGTSGADSTLTATNTNSAYTIINGEAGDDIIAASNKGNDVLMGGGGNDTLNGGNSRDLLYGGVGNDTINGNAGNDFVFGGAGNDIINGGADNLATTNGGVWNTSSNTGDVAGFYVWGNGAAGPSYAYDSDLGGIAIRSGAMNVAKLTFNSTTSAWTVLSLAGDDFGNTDTVTGIETFVFDYGSGDDQITGGSSSALTVATSELLSLWQTATSPEYGAIGGSPSIGQTYVMSARGPDNDVIPTLGTTMSFKVYMSSSVTVAGSPNLQLVIGDAANHKTVLATYDSAASTAAGSNVLVFNYTFGAGDTGQLAIGNLYVPPGASITGSFNNGPAFLRIDDTSNIQANAWVYATPGQTGTAGNDWIFNPSNVDVSDAAKLTAALNSISAGAGGDRDLLDLRLAGAGSLTHSEITNGYQVSMAGRTFQILNESGSVNLYEVVNNTSTIIKSITGLGFERLKLTHVDANGAELESGSLTLVQSVFDDAIRNVQLVQGTAFADAINRSGSQSKYQIIWSDSGNDTVTGSENGDSIDINEGTDTINAGGGDDFLAWHDAGTATIDGGMGTDKIRMFAGYVPSLSGSTTYQLEGDGKVHVRVGGTDAIVIEKAASGAGYEYKLVSSQESAGQNNMIAQVSNMETLSLSTQTNSTDIAFSAIAALFPAVSTTAKVNWTTVDNGPVVMNGEKVEVQVHFASSVTITGTPTLSLIITDDSNVAHTVNASFVPWTQGQSTVTQSSMKFEYTVTDSDVGQIHIGSISVPSGASIVDAANTSLTADLTLTDSLRSIGELQTYLYGGARTTSSATGSAESDLLTYYIDGAGKGNAPTNGTFAAIDGGAGGRDVLGVPILLPNTVTTQTQADGYSMRFNSTTSTIEVLDSSGAVVSGLNSVVPATGSFPAGVEVLVYFLQWRDPSVTDVNAAGAYKDTDAGEMVFSSAVAQIDGKVVSTDHFVIGTANSDTINKSADTNTASRYFIRSGEGNDNLTGGSGSDSFRAGGGDDYVDAGAGNDGLFVERGVDTFDGGAGRDDVILQVQGMQPALLSRFSGPAIGSQTGTWNNGVFAATSTTGEYRLRADDSGNLIVKDFSTDGTIVSTTAANVERIQVRYEDWDGRTLIAFQNGSSGSDTLTINNTSSNTVTGSTSYTFLNAEAGDDNITASNNGNDVLWGGSGNDTLNGGSSRDLLYGGTGTDTLTGNGGNDFLFGGAGNDTIAGGTDSFSGTWNATTNAGDVAGFVVNGTGTSALSYAYDSALGGVAIRQGANNLAKLTYNSAISTWTVQDLAGSNYSFDGNANFHNGTDTVTGVETFVFDYAQSYGNYSLNVAAADVLALLPSTATSINWTANQTGAVAVQDDKVQVMVHFTNPVVVTGTPVMNLTISDGVTTKQVQATFQQYSGVASGAEQTSMQFVYTVGATDVGQFHIDSISLNGGTINEAPSVGGLPANLALTDTNRAITADTYLYGDNVSMGLAGTADSEIMLYYMEGAGVASIPSTAAAYNAGIDAGAGNRDILVVPLRLPTTVTSLDEASKYLFSYDAANNLMKAISSTGTVVATVGAPSTATYPANVELMVYVIEYSTDNGANWESTNRQPAVLVKASAQVADPVVGTEYFVSGSQDSDSIDLSTDTSLTSRYLVRASTGADTITGHAGVDAVFGGGGNDTINTGDGNDLIFVDYGTDTVNGGLGSDRLVVNLLGQEMGIRANFTGPTLQSLYRDTSNNIDSAKTYNEYRLGVGANDNGDVTVRDFGTLGSITNVSATGVENLEVRMGSSDNRYTIPILLGTATGANTADTLSAAGVNPTILSGLDGNDTLNASNLGNDMLFGGGGADTLNGGSGRDFLYAGGGADNLFGNGGNDFLFGGGGNDIINGGADLGGVWNSSTNGMDVAGFFVSAGGAAGTQSTQGTAMISLSAFDAVNQAYFVRGTSSTGTVDVAKITKDANNNLVVQDLSNSANNTSHSGTDTVSNVETLIFDYTSSSGSWSYSINVATLTFL
jgi:Ca2+-binding RTX toxin-like protein